MLIAPVRIYLEVAGRLTPSKDGNKETLELDLDTLTQDTSI
jgi:hypothetical protein